MSDGIRESKALSEMHEGEEGEEGEGQSRYARFLATTAAAAEADSSDEEGGLGERKQGEDRAKAEVEDDQGPGENQYAFLGEDDEFGEFMGPDEVDMDTDMGMGMEIDADALFRTTLANLELRDNPRGGSHTSSSSAAGHQSEQAVGEDHGGDDYADDENEAEAGQIAADKVLPPPPPPPPSIAPLTDDKIATIKQAMAKFTLKPRPGADALADSILTTYRQAASRK